LRPKSAADVVISLMLASPRRRPLSKDEFRLAGRPSSPSSSTLSSFDDDVTVARQKKSYGYKGPFKGEVPAFEAPLASLEWLKVEAKLKGILLAMKARMNGILG